MANPNEQPDKTPQHPPGTYPGESAPEVPLHPGPDEEMPTRRGRPGQDEPEYPSHPMREIPEEPPRQPEYPGMPEPMPDPTPVIR